MIYCADCGGAFGCKAWHSNTKYERRIWRCNNKYGRGKTPCATPHVTDTDVEQAFVEALAERVKSNTGARNALEILEATVFDTSELEARYNQASTKHADLDAQITDRQVRLEQARAICDFLDSNPPLEYSDDAWSIFVDHAVVGAEGTVSVRFKDVATDAHGPEAGGQF